MTRAAWFHCFAGTAGDMTLGALVDAGAAPDDVIAILAALPVDDYELTFQRVQRCGVAATHALVTVHHPGVHDHHPHRPYAEIRRLLDTADLQHRVRARAQRTFAALADAESRVHGTTPDEVEFHEVGAVDAIVDVVGVCAALEVLDIDRIVCSPITVGQGTVQSAHGELPTPAPAVTNLLASRGAPARGIPDRRELATPTGVALMIALADEFGPLPAVDVTAVGYGAGTTDIPGRPNVVQVVIGDLVADAPGPGQAVVLLECNVDDVSGEIVAHTIDTLLRGGAHDAWAAPILMKKGRPAHTVSALCDPALLDRLRATLVAETGSLGVRATGLARWPQQREEITVELDGHAIRVKVAAQRIKVEHDDAAAAAEATGLPLRIVLERAARAATDASER